MQEFVFLPTRETRPESSFQSLAEALSSTAKLSVAPRAQSVREDGLSGAVIAMASQSAAVSAGAAQENAAEIEMIDFVQKSGAVLLRAEELPEVHELGSGTLVPVHLYRPAIADVRVGRSKVKLNTGPAATDFFKLELRYAEDNSPVVGAVLNLRRTGEEEIAGVSDPNGVVTLPLRTTNVTNARILVEPGFAGHWGYIDDRVSLDSGDTLRVSKIDLSTTTDALRHLMKVGGPADGAGVRVAVVDSGVGPHTDLPNAIGDDDTSIGHGSHVAGIIGGHGANGLGGVAPGVELLSYRVFDDPSTGVARNFDIHRAIEQAIIDGCHIINLSLKSEFRFAPQTDDPVISRALEDAADSGVLCVAAAGNDFRRFVAFPARHPDALSVSALGWEPGLPPNAYDRWTVTSDRSANDPAIYFASFSNEGVDNTEVNLVGPGSGVISTVPGGVYAPMSGTSMACPAIVGTIARLLSANLNILAMPGDRDRTAAIRQIVQNSLQDAGFDSVKQGDGTLV
jgi:subtilisin